MLQKCKSGLKDLEKYIYFNYFKLLELSKNMFLHVFTGHQLKLVHLKIF